MTTKYLEYMYSIGHVVIAATIVYAAVYFSIVLHSIAKSLKAIKKK